MNCVIDLVEAPRWWDGEDSLKRFISDLIAAEMAALRPSGIELPPRPWSDSTHFSKDLGADSLELLSVASALAEALQMHHAGFEDYLLARPTLGDWVGIARASLNCFSGSLIFRTSGSTGTPKACSHTLDSLWQEVHELTSLFQGTKRILCAVPAHHIYGFLFTVLLPQGLGLSMPVVDLRGGSPARLARELRAGDLVIGHPEFWRAVARTVPVLPSDAVGVTSTAPCGPEVCRTINESGLGRFFQIYGSSETGGIGWRVHNDEPYTLFSYWTRPNRAANDLTRRFPDGTCKSYAPQDLLSWNDDHRFQVAGRIDTAVQVSGKNVFPAHVRTVLMQHPDVLDAAVRLMRADEGGRLKAFIVPKSTDTDIAELHAALVAWVESWLAAAERPKAFSFGSSLPKGEAGKTADWRIESLVSSNWSA